MELLGVLVGMMVLVPEVVKTEGDISGSITVSCGTDNLGNTYLLDRAITTTSPLGVALMEVAHQCRRRGLHLRADWIPRLENQEADDLTNMEFKSFDVKRRIWVGLDYLEFGVMRKLFDVGDVYLEELDRLKAESKLSAAGAGRRRNVWQVTPCAREIPVTQTCAQESVCCPPVWSGGRDDGLKEGGSCRSCPLRGWEVNGEPSGIYIRMIRCCAWPS